MTKLAWKPWHQVVQLRDDLKTGDLSLNQFAADLYEVMMQRGERLIYEKPAEFFALTYPTYNLRQLAREVVLRLAGQNDKAVRQLALTYGGGKTHTLITLFHLVNDPEHLPDLPAVHEFVTEIGMTPPKARIAALCADKLDVEKGMEVRSPCGETRWLKQPWSVLAYQIAGDEGLKVLSATGSAEERESAPAENLLQPLLALPAKEGLATLVLIDELLMFAMEKIALAPEWRHRLVNFCQYLTQAATKVDRCCVVASLLASDPRKTDRLGKEIQAELYDIFQRQREEIVEPVVKEDVAEVLRRRFFKPDSIRDVAAFRPRVVEALKGIAVVDPQTQKEGAAAEERFLASYPFHPDLTEVLYVKWTGLERFQRTRGVLRTFALALREAEKWDQSPLIGANVFLAAPGDGGLSEAARELVTVAETEEYEGRRMSWAAILVGELGRARQIQIDSVGLKFREMEQAVFATFLHSQPIGQSADAGTHGAAGRDAAGQDRVGEGFAAVGHLQPLARRQFHRRDRRSVADCLAAGQPAQPDANARRGDAQRAKVGRCPADRRDSEGQAAHRGCPGRRGAGPPLARETQRRGGQRRVPLCSAGTKSGVRLWQAQRRG